MTTPTDLDALVLPDEVRIKLAEPRSERIDDHGFNLDLSWWNARLQEYGLPGGPVTGRRDGEVVANGQARVTRGHLFAVAAEGTRDEALLRLLWHALLWGSGTARRNNRQRLRAVSADVRAAAAALEEAASLAGRDPRSAYEVLRSGRRNVISYLGPAFFTKFLYFAGAGEAGHPSPIFDSRVADALKRRCGWSSMTIAGQWPASTYARYCALLSRWATEESARLGRPVGVDEFELWLFERGEGPAERSRRMLPAHN